MNIIFDFCSYPCYSFNNRLAPLGVCLLIGNWCLYKYWLPIWLDVPCMETVEQNLYTVLIHLYWYIIWSFVIYSNTKVINIKLWWLKPFSWSCFSKLDLGKCTSFSSRLLHAFSCLSPTLIILMHSDPQKTKMWMQCLSIQWWYKA